MRLIPKILKQLFLIPLYKEGIPIKGNTYTILGTFPVTPKTGLKSNPQIIIRAITIELSTCSQRFQNMWEAALFSFSHSGTVH